MCTTRLRHHGLRQGRVALDAVSKRHTEQHRPLPKEALLEQRGLDLAGRYALGLPLELDLLAGPNRFQRALQALGVLFYRDGWRRSWRGRRIPSERVSCHSSGPRCSRTDRS